MTLALKVLIAALAYVRTLVRATIKLMTFEVAFLNYIISIPELSLLEFSYVFKHLMAFHAFQQSHINKFEPDWQRSAGKWINVVSISARLLAV